MKIFVGIDPGIFGGIAFLKTDSPVSAIPFKKFNINNLILLRPFIVSCYIEGVNAMPGQGVVSTFKFGKNFGWWHGVLQSLDINYTVVYPLKWQNYLNCRSGGDKRVTKQKAQELYPGLKVTHAIADALLIATYAKRKYLDL